MNFNSQIIYASNFQKFFKLETEITPTGSIPIMSPNLLFCHSVKFQTESEPSQIFILFYLEYNKNVIRSLDIEKGGEKEKKDLRETE